MVSIREMDSKLSLSHRNVAAFTQNKEMTATGGVVLNRKSFLWKRTSTHSRRTPARNSFSLNQRQKKGALRGPILSLVCLMAGLLALVFMMSSSSESVRRLGSRRRLIGSRTTVILNFEDDMFVQRSVGVFNTSVVHPPKLKRKDALKTILPDFGGLVIRIAEDKSKRLERRSILHEFQHDLEYENMMNLDDDDSVEGYYAFDDDNERNPLMLWDDPDIHKQKRCRRTNWHRSLYSNCLSFHEYDTLSQFRQEDLKYVS